MGNISEKFLRYPAAAAGLSVAAVVCYLLAGARSSISSAMTAHSQNPVCSFDVFRDVARSLDDGFVRGTGTWSRSASGAPERFQPDICRFRHGPNLPGRHVVNCIQQHRLQYIVFAGDSNAGKYYSAFRTLLIKLGASCALLRVRYLLGVFTFSDKLVKSI